MSKHLLKVNNVTVSADEVLTFMKLTGLYHQAHTSVAMNNFLREYVIKDGTTVPEAALQAYSDARRTELKITRAAEMKRFLDALGVSQEDWENTLENELYRIEFRKKYGSKIFVGDAWNILKTIPAVRDKINERVISKAENLNLKNTSKEIHEESDTQRRAAGLHKVNDFRVYLDSNAMSLDDWEKNININLYAKKLADKNIAPLTSQEVADVLAASPVINDLITRLVYGFITKAKAIEKNLAVSESELQEYTDNFRRALNLHKTNHFIIWLQTAGLTVDEFEKLAETAVLSKKVVADLDKIEDGRAIENSIKCSTYFADAMLEVTFEKILSAKAKEESLQPTEKEMQDYSDSLRRIKGMHSVGVFNDHLKFYNLTIDDWACYVERYAAIAKLREKETTQQKVLKYFEKNPAFEASVKKEIFSGYAYNLFAQADLKWS
jgi:hypothetical protein